MWFQILRFGIFWMCIIICFCKFVKWPTMTWVTLLFTYSVLNFVSFPSLTCLVFSTGLFYLCFYSFCEHWHLYHSVAPKLVLCPNLIFVPLFSSAISSDYFDKPGFIAHISSSWYKWEEYHCVLHLIPKRVFSAGLKTASPFYFWLKW